MAKQKTSKKTPNKSVDNEVLAIIYSFLAIALSIIGILEIGPAGVLLSRLMYFFVGVLENILFGLVIVGAILVITKKDVKQLKFKHVIGIVSFFFACELLVAAPEDHSIVGIDVIRNFLANTKQIFDNTLVAPIGNGGVLGALLYSMFSGLFDYVGTIIMTIMFIMIGLLMFIEPIKKFFGFANDKVQTTKEKSKEKKAQKEREKLLYDEEISYENNQAKFEFGKINVDKVDKVEDNILIEEKPSQLKVIDIKPDKVEEEVKPEKKDLEIETSFLVDYSKYRLPGLNLLNLSGKGNVSANNKKAAAEAGQKLLQILEEFGVKATLVDTHIGPSVTKFELKPDLGVKVSKISNLQNDIKLALAAKDIRIEAPIPSKSAVGIEIPNVDKTIVGLRELLRSVHSKYDNSKLLFVLGKDLLGQPVYGELNKMPHLLIAGATGSGKSVCVNSIIVSILMRAKPDEVKLLHQM